jgi:ribose transport system ATP-binding protein
LDEAPVLDASGFTKSFSGRTVLRGVDLVVRRGEIHALVGQNGSGKSTFIKILSGYHPPDPGASLRVNGQEIRLPMHPDTPGHMGVTFVHQDLGLFEDGTVLENLLVGQYRTGFGWRVSWPTERRRAREILDRYGLTVDPEAPLRTLSAVERTIVAIARALSKLPASEGALLVLDEPTARLPSDSVDAFFATVRGVVSSGNGVLFVSHRLEEVVELAHQVTVLRDGAVAARFAAPNVSVRDLVVAIVGSALGTVLEPPAPPPSEVVLGVQGLAGGTVADFTANLHRGEVLGVTGLLGMGHDAVPYLLFGAEHARAGTLGIGRAQVEARDVTPLDSMALGMALLPGNRARDAAVGDATARENITLATLSRYVRTRILRPGAERAAVARLMTAFDVQPPESEALMTTFSGGNQQKALIAKWLERQPSVLLLDEPTHGVDVGAKAQILAVLAEAARNGMAILISSVEADDLVRLCHRVLVMRHGRVVAELSGAALTAHAISEQAQLSEAVPAETPA